MIYLNKAKEHHSPLYSSMKEPQKDLEELLVKIKRGRIIDPLTFLQFG